MRASDQALVVAVPIDAVATARLCFARCRTRAGAGSVNRFRAAGAALIRFTAAGGSVLATEGEPTRGTAPPVGVGIASQYSLIALPAGAPQPVVGRCRAARAGDGAAKLSDALPARRTIKARDPLTVLITDRRGW